MGFRALLHALVVSALLICGYATAVYAQGSQPLSIAISTTNVSNGRVTIGLTIANNAKTTAYVLDAALDSGQFLRIDSGPTLENPLTPGIERCGNELKGCLWITDTNSYSSIEPGDSLDFQFEYGTATNISETATASFSVVLATKFATSDPSRATAVKPFRKSFPHVPLNHH